MELHQLLFSDEDLPFGQLGETILDGFACDRTLRSKANILSSISAEESRLPPCRICKMNASGFHYGVNTCNACKGFFARSILKSARYKCSGGGHCNITLFGRNNCPACRFQKCLALGMSKNAIKTGRYTHRKRTQDILEIQKLREGKSPSIQDEDSRLSILDVPALSSPAEEDSERLTSLLLESHNKFMNTAVSDTSMEKMEKDQQTYYDQYNFVTSLFEPVRELSWEQYDEIYQTTGIDIDNRQDMMRIFAATMEVGIRRYINFMKAVPEFSMLSSDDQANLIKHARFEFFFLGSYRGYNNKLKILSTSSGKCLHIKEVCKLWDEDFMLAVFNFSDSLKSLNLSEEECILVRTMLVLFRDRCELQNPEQVESIQWKVICALLHVLAKNHSRPYLRFAKILDRLAAVRDLTEWSNLLDKKLCMWPAVQESPLLLEMLEK